MSYPYIYNNSHEELTQSFFFIHGQTINQIIKYDCFHILGTYKKYFNKVSCVEYIEQFLQLFNFIDHYRFDCSSY